MARRAVRDKRLVLSPRARAAAGWLVAAGLLLGVALAFRLLGGDGAGTAIDPGRSTSPGDDSLQIAFGTRLDTTTGEVAPDARVERFAAGDTFIYSVRPAEPPPQTVYVEVRRLGEGGTVVQPAAALRLPEGAVVIAYSVPAANLVGEFGAGRYVMLILAEPTADPLARGEFELVTGEPAESAGP